MEKEIKLQEDAVEIAIDFSSPDINFQPQSHNGEQIYQTVVSPDMSYVVTYSKDDNSILGWQINIEKDQQQPDVYFPLGENGLHQPDDNFSLDEPYQISSFVLHKKILLFYYKLNEANDHYYRKYYDTKYDINNRMSNK